MTFFQYIEYIPKKKKRANKKEHIEKKNTYIFICISIFIYIEEKSISNNVFSHTYIIYI